VNAGFLFLIVCFHCSFQITCAMTSRRIDLLQKIKISGFYGAL